MAGLVCGGCLGRGSKQVVHPGLNLGGGDWVSKGDGVAVEWATLMGVDFTGEAGPAERVLALADRDGLVKQIIETYDIFNFFLDCAAHIDASLYTPSV